MISSGYIGQPFAVGRSNMTREHQRLIEDRERRAYWKRWGPYLSERQWGTVREDYSPDGSAWDYFPHDQARSRAYRWGEDGILGLSDTHQRLCFGIALWNEADPYLKERLFGLAGPQGNHGEDVKEYYFYLDSTPTHSYMKGLYKYPQVAYPYDDLVQENNRRLDSPGRGGWEYELLDTGIFNDHRYFDVVVEYAKASPEDILIQISVTNRGPDPAPLHLLPTLWFRNTWSWDRTQPQPQLRQVTQDKDLSLVQADHPELGQRWFYCQNNPQNNSQNTGSLLFTDNETNQQKIFGVSNLSPYVKDGIHDYVVSGIATAVNPDQIGTKMSPHYAFTIQPGETQRVKLRLCDRGDLIDACGPEFDQEMAARLVEADEFYAQISTVISCPHRRSIQRQAFAGMLWTKQYYHYVIETWLQGDAATPPPPDQRLEGRNSEWIHLFNDDILSMPDKWEYPWFAAWDLAFHAIPLAMVDPEFAKRQLDLMTREWYMHPNGQIPAYEWQFGDVNPPVHAWATYRVYQIEQKMFGRADRQFLERVFQKLLLNFTWWVNRKDEGDNNVFEGGFLGLDNIGVFDRSAPLPTGGYIEQADGTSWMGMYCLNLLTVALELAQDNSVYEDIASKFYEHFLYIADAMNKVGGKETQLWDQEDGFYYDVLRSPDGDQIRLKVRSMVGLIPLYAVSTIEPETLKNLPRFRKRVQWFIDNRPDLTQNVVCMRTEGWGERRLLSIVYQEKLQRILAKMLDETEFLSEYGIRALSRFHRDQPYMFHVGGQEHRVDYEPAESSTGLFGGNSNWRGPIWMPVNYLLIESLQRFHFYYGDSFKVECPTGSGQYLTLWEVALELERRLIKIFLPDEQGRRPLYGGMEIFQSDPHWRDWILFHEYFHGDNGAGLGASHQTGWTGLIAKLIQQTEEYDAGQKAPDLTVAH